MRTLEAEKNQAREAAFQRRSETFQAPDAGARNLLAAARLTELLEPHAGKTIAGYMPMRSEIDPLPAMTRMAALSPVSVPVIVAKGQALDFALWTPDSEMTMGTFGARVPRHQELRAPEVLVVPLVGFDREGGRLGYGGGFYDRTLEGLRALRPTLAIGFAWAAQEEDALPLEATDQPLDYIVTENETIRF